MRTTRLEDIVLPPEPPEVREQRRNLIGELSTATAVAAVVFLVGGALLGLLAFQALRAGAWITAVLWALLVVMVYVGTGVALCGAFARRLRFWGGAALSRIVEGKMNFVRSWPWASTRLLWQLIFHEATGGGGGYGARPY